MNQLNPKKGILLFEVVFVVLIVSIISLFLFRGYGIFSKAARRNLDCLKLMMLSEEKIWDLQAIEKADGELSSNMERQGDFELSPFSWNLAIEESGYGRLKRGTVEIKRNDKQAPAFETVFFLNFE
ncbi:MAG: hypothetical protein ABIH08_05060 [Candidatus Omnitrophota bacterium]